MEQKTKLLLAEDDENLGLLLREYLVAKGYDANLFPDGHAAYKGFTKEHYDICILDIMMPQKDGFTLAKDIRIINPDIPIIFLTGRTDSESELFGLNMGAMDYIHKPIVSELLLRRIEIQLSRLDEQKNPQG